MPVALTLLRHTTPEQHAGLCYGRTDLAIAPSFEAEAAALIPGLPVFSTVLSSPLSRCRHLAERIAKPAGLTVTVVPEWIEMDFGRWEGQRWSDIPRRDLDAWAADFMDYRGHGGESVAMLASRVAQGLDRAPEGALIVTHAGTIKAALAARKQPGAWDHRSDFGTWLTV